MYTKSRDTPRLAETCKDVTGYRNTKYRPAMPNPIGSTYLLHRLPTRVNLSDSSDEDLLEYLAMYGEEQHTADDLALIKEAFAELYRRHAKSVYTIFARSPYAQCIIEQEGLGAITSLVSDSFLKVRGPIAASYDPKKAKVKTWLCQIAHNLLCDQVRRIQRQRESLTFQSFGNDREFPGQDVTEPNEPELPGRLTPKEFALYTEALEQCLSKRQKQHLTAYMEIQVDGRADHGALEALATRLHTTPEAIRKNKSRALQKIKQHIDAHTAQ